MKLDLRKAVDKKKYFSVEFKDRHDVYADHEIVVRGRILRARGPFIDIRSNDGDHQIFFDGKMDKGSKVKLSIGSFIEVSGVPTQSNAGNDIIAAHSYKELSQAYSSIKNIDANSPIKTFLEAVSNKQKSGRIQKQGAIVFEIGSFFVNEGAQQVFTDITEDVDVGLKSRSFAINNTRSTLRRDFDVATRAYLLFGSSIFQIGAVFRNEGRSKKNRNDLLYCNAFLCHRDMDDALESVTKLLNTLSAKFGSEKLITFRRENLYDAYVKHTEVCAAREENPKSFKEFWREKKRDTIAPTIFIGFTPSVGPFSSLYNEQEPHNLCTKEFAIVCNGKTLVHGSEDLHDYQKQKSRYASMYGGNYERDLPEGEKIYLSVLEHGVPPFSSIGISVDLVIQELLNIDNVNEIRPSVTSTGGKLERS